MKIFETFKPNQNWLYTHVLRTRSGSSIPRCILVRVQNCNAFSRFLSRIGPLLRARGGKISWETNETYTNTMPTLHANQLDEIYISDIELQMRLRLCRAVIVYRSCTPLPGLCLHNFEIKRRLRNARCAHGAMLSTAASGTHQNASRSQLFFQKRANISVLTFRQRSSFLSRASIR